MCYADGVMFEKGYIQTPEHQRKAKEARNSKLGEAQCVICGKEYKKYQQKQKTCGKKACRLEHSKKKYHALKEDDPILYKAVSLSGSIRLGKGKREIMYSMLERALGKPCNYCGIEIDLLNASVDHKVPRTTSKVFDRKKKEMIYTPEEIRHLDRKENLHIVCRNCNQNKGNFSHKEFVTLLAFLEDHPTMKEKLFHRLKMTRMFFSKK